jgi:hypothetical protein
MAENANVNINVNSKADLKGFKQAQTASQKLTKSVKALGAAFGLAISTKAIINFGKQSALAFAADDKAAKTLSRTLNNLGLAFADPEIKAFISTLEKQYGVLDDLLRPAFQKLITTTGDFKKSQSLLTTALDLSAQSGFDLLTVTNDISQAFVGNTRGLVKYNLGLSKVQIAAMSFEDILKRISVVSAGQASLAAETYAGKLNKLTVASENAKEVLGGALLDALVKLGGGDVDKATDKIDKLSTALASLIRLATGTSAMSLKEILEGVDYKFGIIPTNRTKAPRSASPAGTFKNQEAARKAAAAALKAQKELAALQKKDAQAKKSALSLSQAAAFFDVTRISLAAALKATYDKEDRLRLEALIAIENDNGALAIAKIEELAALQNSKDMDRLKGITVIKDSVLAAINEQLLAELHAIDATELKENEKERLRDIAFGKYNAAIVAAGDIAEKTYYSERVQIQLTEIAKLASLSNTVNAMRTGELLRLDVSLSVISKIREAQAAADEERMKALLSYIDLLKTLGGEAVGLKGASSDSIAALIDGSEAELSALVIDKAAIDSINKTDNLMSELFKVYNNSGTSALAAFGAIRNLKEDSYASSLMPFDSDSKLSAMARGAGMTYNVTVNAGVVGSEQTIVDAVQNAILSINRAGDSTVVAGAL